MQIARRGNSISKYGYTREAGSSVAGFPRNNTSLRVTYHSELY